MSNRIQVHPQILAVLLVLLTGCASGPQRFPTPGDDIARTAMRFQGIPYRYGGDDPRGFDCSGLVHYVHRRNGLNVPRTARDQWHGAERVPTARLQPGDLLFFHPEGKNWHVGIYIGRGRFVHAPSSGGRVRVERLNDYWRRYYLGAGRYWH